MLMRNRTRFFSCHAASGLHYFIFKNKRQEFLTLKANSLLLLQWDHSFVSQETLCVMCEKWCVKFSWAPIKTSRVVIIITHFSRFFVFIKRVKFDLLTDHFHCLAIVCLSFKFGTYIQSHQNWNQILLVLRMFRVPVYFLVSMH